MPNLKISEVTSILIDIIEHSASMDQHSTHVSSICLTLSLRYTILHECLLSYMKAEEEETTR